jgi:copper(I)-binding protein
VRLIRSYLVWLVWAAFMALGAAHAQVTVSNAWVRATVAQQTATGAFMQIRSTQTLQLVGVRTPLTPVAQVHQMSMSNGVMRMTEVASVEVGPTQPLELKPGGYHVMLMDLKRALQPGQPILLTLVFSRPSGPELEVLVKAEVRRLGAKAPGHHWFNDVTLRGSHFVTRCWKAMAA